MFFFRIFFQSRPGVVVVQAPYGVEELRCTPVFIYASFDTEEIRHRWRDIRYFHERDIEQALLLQKQFNEFVKDRAPREINLKVKNLSRRYPRAKRGSIEVWVYF
jgi:hypothetical protein